MLAVYLFRATSGAHHQEGLVMTLTASSSSRAVTNSPVVVALDYHNRDAALAFVDKIDPRDCRLKVGKEMFTLFGPQFVRELQQRGFDIFLDLKFHDIPNTAAHAVAALGRECGICRGYVALRLSACRFVQFHAAHGSTGGRSGMGRTVPAVP